LEVVLVDGFGPADVVVGVRDDVDVEGGRVGHRTSAVAARGCISIVGLWIDAQKKKTKQKRKK
jgi:hypothetical protein